MSTGLPQLADAKAYLRQTDTTAEDTLIGALLDRAYGVVQGYLARPIASIQNTFVVEGMAPTKALRVGTSPIDLTQPITVVDGTGITLPATWYRANATLGLLLRTPPAVPTSVVTRWSWWWDCWPYTVTLSSGLSARSDYTLVVAPAVGAAILDCVADAFARRSPAATSEAAGGGVSQSFPQVSVGITARAAAYLGPFRMVTV